MGGLTLNSDSDAVQPPGVDRMAADACTAEARLVACDGEHAVIAVRLAPEHAGTADCWSVGRLIAIGAGGHRLVGLIDAIETDQPWPSDALVLMRVRAELQGEIRTGADGVARFSSGIANYPPIGASACPVRATDLAAIYCDFGGARHIRVGHLSQDSALSAQIDADRLVDRHFALVGTTGAGKSTALALILRGIVSAHPQLGILLLDPHDEFTAALGDLAVTLDADALELPYWLFAFDELVDVLYRGHPAVPEETDLLRDLIPVAREQYRIESSGYRLRRLRRVEASAVTADTPYPYRMSDLVALIREREGLLDSRAERPFLRGLRTRIESVLTDPRFRFMCQARGPGDRLGDVLSSLIRHPSAGRPVTIIAMAGLPSEVMRAVVSVLARLAFDVAVASTGAVRTLVVCEEAHRYIPADPAAGFHPVRRAIARIAREGRKHGASLAVVSQRPGELDPTVLAQCSTIFALRLGNARDKAIVESALTGAARSTISFLSALADREAIAFGAAVPAPMRMRFAEAATPPRIRDIAAPSVQASDPRVIEGLIARLRREGEPPVTSGIYASGSSGPGS